jgi:hypothetical protein
VGEAVEFPGDAIGLLSELEGIDAVNGVEEGEDLADFIFLEVTDEMPMETGREEGNFCECFLDAIFSEKGVSGVDDILNHFGGPGLGNDEQLDIVGLASGFFGGLGEEIFHVNEVFGDV